MACVIDWAHQFAILYGILSSAKIQELKVAGHMPGSRRHLTNQFADFWLARGTARKSNAPCAAGRMIRTCRMTEYPKLRQIEKV